MAILPTQKKRQQVLFAVLAVVVALIFISWFFGFRALAPRPEQPLSSLKSSPKSFLEIPKLDWNFLSSLEQFEIFIPPLPESVTSGRQNPFLTP